MIEYVHYGCGLCAPVTWRNFDASPTLRLRQLPLLGQWLARSDCIPSWPDNVEYGDIVKGLPVPDHSCKAIYCSHVLEHLALEDFRTALQKTFGYLLVGGVFRFVVPDLKKLASDFVLSKDPKAAMYFMEASYLGVKHRPRGLGGLTRAWLGNSNHLWMWDYASIAEELEIAGFRNIRRAEFGDSQVPMFVEVEDRNRWLGCLGVECEK